MKPDLAEKATSAAARPTHKVRRVIIESDSVPHTTTADGATVIYTPDASELAAGESLRVLHFAPADVDTPPWVVVEDVEDYDDLREHVAREQENRQAEHGGGGIAVPMEYVLDASGFSPESPTIDGTFREDRDTERMVAEANAFLRSNGPRLVALEVERGANRWGLTVEELRGVFHHKGRPSVDLRERRELVRWALADVWEMTEARDSGANRSLLADVLGCSRTALYALMEKP